MAEKTPAQKKAQQKYMEQFAIARVRMSREKHEAVQEIAAANGESVSGYINRLIDEDMKGKKEG